MKGQKRKKKEEKYDREEEPEQLVENVSPQPSKRVKTDGSESEKEEKAETVVDDMPGIPIAPMDTGNNKQRVIFVLEKASLEIAKVGKVRLSFREENLQFCFCFVAVEECHFDFFFFFWVSDLSALEFR